MNRAQAGLHRILAAWPLIIGVLVGTVICPESQAGELFTRDFSFNDKLGGFRLLSATGTGTADDPVVVVEEVHDAAPFTLVVRRQNWARLNRRSGVPTLTLEKVVVNRSGRVWAGFEIELQEVLNRPSGYTDGLSFNQIGARGPDVSSDSFSENNRLFEPYDRIRFQTGHVNPNATARFRITITDPTPDMEFYIVQDPQILSAGLQGGRSFAAR